MEMDAASTAVLILLKDFAVKKKKAWTCQLQNGHTISSRRHFDQQASPSSLHLCTMYGNKPIRTLPTTSRSKRRYEGSITDDVIREFKLRRITTYTKTNPLTPIPDGMPLLSDPTVHPAVSIVVQQDNIPLTNDADEVLYVKQNAPATVIETLEAAWKQCGSQGRKLYTVLATEYIELAEMQSRDTVETYGSMRFGPHMIKYWYDFHVQFIAFNDEDIAEEITLEWARRCCGVIKDPGTMNSKLQTPVSDKFVEAARADMLTHGGKLIREPAARLPEAVVAYMCTVMNEYILRRYPKALTWYFPDDNIAHEAEWYHEVKNHNCVDICYQSEFIIDGGNSYWLWDNEHYPLKPGDRYHIPPFTATKESQTFAHRPEPDEMIELKKSYDIAKAYEERCRMSYPRPMLEADEINNGLDGNQGANAP